AHTLASEPGVRVTCAPGNPGIASAARCVQAELSKPDAILAVAEAEGVDLTVVGPELPLSLGVVDLFTAAGRAIVGPTRAAAALESSKAFAKDFMQRHRVPTARYRVCSDAADAREAVRRGELGFPLVVKADGLAAGKGVVIAEDQTTALATIEDAMVARRFGDAGECVVLEECLVGPEVSFFVLADGRSFVTMASAQDHKRIFDNDRGPNTGGMGAFAPSPLMTADVERAVIDQVVHPVLEGMRAEGAPYRGFLYVGLMLTAHGPKVIEFNVRFGDPEAQVVLPMIDGGLADLLMAAATGALAEQRVRLRDEPHVGIVVASQGYPDAPRSGDVITGLDAAAAVPGALVFHAGTALRDGAVVTSGGRVLTVVGGGPSFRQAIDIAYRAVSHLKFAGMQYRSDIGRKAMQ
ncbi:MAG TPA: phosphoribosylamine--glycine ligase, partial [Vicinamibacterales bacterium]